MEYKIQLYSTKKNEINKFLNALFGKTLNLKDDLKWEKNYNNPIDLVEFIGCFIDNNDKFDMTMWISIDKDILINISSSNANNIIKYLYERFPY